MNWFYRLIKETTRETFSLYWIGLTKIPLLFYVGVSVAELSPERNLRQNLRGQELTGSASQFIFNHHETVPAH